MKKSKQKPKTRKIGLSPSNFPNHAPSRHWSLLTRPVVFECLNHGHPMKYFAKCVSDIVGDIAEATSVVEMQEIVAYWDERTTTGAPRISRIRKLLTLLIQRLAEIKATATFSTDMGQLLERTACAISELKKLKKSTVFLNRLVGFFTEWFPDLLYVENFARILSRQGITRMGAHKNLPSARINAKVKKAAKKKLGL